MVDSDLKVFLMEANMSPNLSTGHFKQNRLLYEQVIFNVVSLVGIALRVPGAAPSLESTEMQVSDKDLNLHFPECDGIDDENDCIKCAKNVSLVSVCEREREILGEREIDAGSRHAFLLPFFYLISILFLAGL